MYRAFNKLSLSILSVLLLGNIAFGVQNEYKNSLLKVELQKAGDNSYSVNLYTQSNFQEPVRVIKKTDLNYYILLPETKNKAATILTNSKDIRNVTIEQFKYEGADVDNGYIKVNINTSKPLYFNVSTKLNTSGIKKPTVALLQQKVALQSDKKENVEKIDRQADKLIPIQKKNFEFQPKNLIKTQKKVTEEAKKPLPVLQEAIVGREDIFEENIIDEPIEENKLENIEVIQDEAMLQNNYLNENFDEIAQIANSQNGKNSSFKLKLQNKLTQYNLDLKDLFLMCFVGILSFFAMFAILLRKQKQVRLRNKKELLKTASPFVEKEEKTPSKNDGQYFIFDSGIKQTGLISPATSEEPKKFELSSYDPDLKENYTPGSFREYVECNEFDIIQKALKDEAPKNYDLSASCSNVSEEKKQTYEEVKKQVEQKNEIKNQHSTQKPIKQETKKEEYIEPQVLSKVEIAPERGFMCISYNDNINLMGYIFDDVFPLYSFKQAKLENYDIKYRLSDKTQNGTNFIVKLDKTKFLISVKNSSMSLEVVL